MLAKSFLDEFAEFDRDLACLSLLLPLTLGLDLEEANVAKNFGLKCRKNFGRTGMQLTMVPMAISA